MKNKIVVVGSSNTDMIIKSPRIPKEGETILGGEFTTAAGGKGANQAVAAARAGGNVTLVASIGNDSLGKQAIKGFGEDGINTDFIITDMEKPSGVALIMVDEKGANSISVASGANANLTPEVVINSKSVIVAADILLMQLETPIETIKKASEIAKEAVVKVILNPAPAQELSNEILSKVDILTPNESEAEILTGVSVVDENTAQQAADTLHSKGINIVIITMGKQGSYLSDANSKKMISGFNVNAVDTTAAGDTFNGALAVALSEDMAIEDAVKFANAAGALSVTKGGAQPSVPYRKDIDGLL